MKGFTLIELLVTVSIVVAVSVFGFVSFSRYKGGEDLELTLSELAAVVRDAQRRTVTGQDGKTWGIRFKNSTSTTHTYEIWSGPNYASGTVDRAYPLRRATLFGNPGDGLNFDALFSAISGKLNETKIISLFNRRKDGLVGDLIMLSRGTVTVRMENGLTGYWHFDEATSTKTYDSSGFTNTGTLVSGPVWQSASNCRAGVCLNFDGVDDYVSVPDNSVLDFNTGQSIAIIAWVRPAALPTFGNILVKGRTAGTELANYAIRQGGNGASFEGRFTFYYRNSSNNTWHGYQTNTDVFTISTWTHVAATYTFGTGSSVKLYVNGVETAGSWFLGNGNEAPAVTNEALWIGADDGTVGGPVNEPFNGRVDEVRIYNRALTATEISNLYNDLK